MQIDIKQYIDFKKLYDDLYKQNENDLILYEYEASHYHQILNFNVFYKEKATLLIEECEFYNNEIIFVFCYEHNNANESDTQNTSESWVITYDRILDEFTDCDYDNG